VVSIDGRGECFFHINLTERIGNGIEIDKSSSLFPYLPPFIIGSRWAARSACWHFIRNSTLVVALRPHIMHYLPFYYLCSFSRPVKSPLKSKKKMVLLPVFRHISPLTLWVQKQKNSLPNVIRHNNLAARLHNNHISSRPSVNKWYHVPTCLVPHASPYLTLAVLYGWPLLAKVNGVWFNPVPCSPAVLRSTVGKFGRYLQASKQTISFHLHLNTWVPSIKANKTTSHSTEHSTVRTG